MSDLLNKASLVMIPSGYKEDTVYSVVPSDGSGDLSFTRASNGTRINSAGLVEVCPWNLVQYSEDLSNAVWTKGGTSITTNATTAPNGTTTADKLVELATTEQHQSYQSIAVQAGTYTFSVYLKQAGRIYASVYPQGSSMNAVVTVNLSTGVIVSATGATYVSSSIESVGDGWYKVNATLTTTANNLACVVYLSNVSGGQSPTYTGNGTDGIFVWGAQLNIGSTAKPYFPTTDRLNVPRLTYQNGGGGCPSLLLEKQSTNLVSYSQDFSNAYWSKLGQGIAATAVLTGNYAISPDGTQNATRFVCNLNGGTSSSDRSWMVASFTAPATSTISIWIKLNSAGTKTFVFSDSGGDTKTISGTDWQRIDGTFVGAGGEFRIGLIGGTGSSDTLDCCIWGAQCEASSYPTSYIPTTSASATRVADACYKTGISSLIGQSEGFIAGEVEGLTNSYGAQSTIMSVSDGTTQNRVMFSFNATTGYVTPRIFKAGSTIFVNDYGITLTQKIKFAIGWGGGRAVCYVNGTQVQETTGLTFFSSGTLTRFGADDGAGSNIGIGKVSEYILGTTNLTNAQLQSLTI